MNIEYTSNGKALQRTGRWPNTISTCNALLYNPNLRNTGRVEIYEFSEHYEVWIYPSGNVEKSGYCVFSSITPPDRHYDE